MQNQTIEIDYGHSEWEYDDSDTIRCDIRHRVYAVVPKCVYEKFVVSTCTRCDYIKTECIYSERIFCCP